MRLADFISANAELILTAWESFARTCLPAARTMDVAALRNDAAAILRAIALDLGRPQSRAQQHIKSHGRSDADPNGNTFGSQSHGTDRADRGFTLEQMMSEFRALRASVLRLWEESGGDKGRGHLADNTRFNEAIDQALAESVERFSHRLDRSREMFLAILGHDLRNPLYGITMTTREVLKSKGSVRQNKDALTLVLDSAEQMRRLITDLLDFTRSRLGSGIPITRADADMGQALIGQIVDEIAAAHPHRVLRVQKTGKLRGSWDGVRIRQMLTNLIANAAEHGAGDTPITIAIRGSGQHVVVSVHNRGPVIAPKQLKHLFEPLKYIVADQGRTRKSGSLGLGLYIAHEIVGAHNGVITAKSSRKSGTTFTVHLPRTMKTATKKMPG